MAYTMYTPLNVWLDPASVTDVVAYIQTYLSENTIYSETEIETIIHDYLIAHPELIGGVQSVNGKTGTVVLSASDINTEADVNIESVLSSLSSQISSIAASVATNTSNITGLTGRMTTAESDLANLKSSIGVSPEDYGAKGDGVTDDTNAINSAVTYCRTNNVQLVSDSGKTYGITSQIDFSDINVNFRNSTIKALSAIQYCIKVNSTADEIKTIENIIIDCNLTSGGIDIINTKHDTLSNINIISCHQTGIVVRAGGGLVLKDSYFVGDGTSTTSGIIVLTSDCEFKNIILKDFYNAINNNGTVNYDSVHAWLSKDCTGTTMFQHIGGSVVISNSQFDTYETAVYRSTDKMLSIIGCVFYINSFLYDSAVTPIFFKGASSSFPYSANIHVSNCTFNPLNTQCTLTNITYNRIQFDNCFFFDGITGNINDIPMTFSKVSTTDAGTYSHLRQEKKWIVYDGILNKTDALTTGYAIIMTIPSSYCYPEGYTARGSAKLYIGAATPSEIVEVGLAVNPNSGAITLNIPSTITISNVYLIEIHFKYPVKSTLDYYRG